MSPPLPPSYSVSIPTSTGNPRDRERRLLQRRLRRSVGGAAAPSSPSTVVAFVVALQLLWLLPARAPCTVAAATISKDPGAPTGGTMAARTAGLTSGLPPETLGSAPGRDAETRSASSSDSSRSGPGRSSVATTMTTTMMMLMRGAETQSTGSRSPSRTEWEDCSREPTVEVRDVFMAPDPPVIGHQFELQLPAVARQLIAGGHVAVTIKFHGLPVHVEYTDICQQTACPVLPGSFTFQYWRNVPSLAFPGPYYARLMATDSNSTELFCIIVTLNVVRGVAGGRVGDGLGSRDTGGIR